LNSSKAFLIPHYYAPIRLSTEAKRDQIRIKAELEKCTQKLVAKPTNDMRAKINAACSEAITFLGELYASVVLAYKVPLIN